MQQEMQMNMFLSRYRFWITVFVLFHAAVWFVWAYGSGGLQFEICLKRATTFDYWHLWGNAFGLLAPALVYWGMWHITYGIYFWFGFITCAAFMIWHGVLAIWYIADQIDCSGTPPCFGCSGSPTDTVWILNWVWVGVMCLLNAINLFLIGVMRSRTEFGLFWWMAAETRTNGNVGFMPAPLGVGVATPAGAGVAQSPAYQFQVFLRGFRFVASINSAFYLCGLVVMAWNFGNLGADTWTCPIRAFHWDYVRYFGNVLGLVGLFAGYWILWHVTFGLWYLAAFVALILAGAWHLILMIFMLHDLDHCSSVIPCVGCGSSGTDWAWSLNFALTVMFVVNNIISLVAVVILRRHANWALYWDVADETRYDPTTGQIPVGYGGLGSGLPAWLGGGNPYTSGAYVQMARTKMAGGEMGASYPSYSHGAIPQTASGREIRSRIATTNNVPTGRDILMTAPVGVPLSMPGVQPSRVNILRMPGTSV